MTVAATTLHVGQDRRDLDPQFGLTNHLEFLSVVMQAGNGQLDERVIPLLASAGDEMSVGGSGLMVPQIWAPQVLGRSVDDPTDGRTLSLTTEAPVVKYAFRNDADHSTSVSGGVRAIRHLETAVPDPSRMSLEGGELGSHELVAFVFGAERSVTDSPVTFIAMVERGIQDEIRSVLLEERMRGSGTGEFLGVLNAGCRIIIPKESGQVAATVTGKNFARMRARCWGYSRAIWILHPELFAHTISASIVDASTQLRVPIWQPGIEAEGIPDRILGRPAFFHECANAPGNEGDVLVADWSQYLDATYVPHASTLGALVSSIHVRFAANERAFRFYLRNDGQPWWRVPLQPKRATATVSPFVTLATRA